GFCTDADHYVPMQPNVADVSVSTQNLKSCLLRFDVTLSASTKSLQDATRAFALSWRELAYTYFEASSIAWYSDCAALRFVTVPQGDLYFVSGCFVARGPLVSEL